MNSTLRLLVALDCPISGTLNESDPAARRRAYARSKGVRPWATEPWCARSSLHFLNRARLLESCGKSHWVRNGTRQKASPVPRWIKSLWPKPGARLHDITYPGAIYAA
jgi:hypothetical protein